MQMIRQFGRSWLKYAPLRQILTPSRTGGITGAAPTVGCYLELSVAIPEFRSIEVPGVRGSFTRVPGWWRVADSSRCTAYAEKSIVTLNHSGTTAHCRGQSVDWVCTIIPFQLVLGHVISQGQGVSPEFRTGGDSPVPRCVALSLSLRSLSPTVVRLGWCVGQSVGQLHVHSTNL